MQKDLKGKEGHMKRECWNWQAVPLPLSQAPYSKGFPAFPHCHWWWSGPVNLNVSCAPTPLGRPRYLASGDTGSPLGKQLLTEDFVFSMLLMPLLLWRLQSAREKNIERLAVPPWEAKGTKGQDTQESGAVEKGREGSSVRDKAGHSGAGVLFPFSGIAGTCPEWQVHPSLSLVPSDRCQSPPPPQPSWYCQPSLFPLGQKPGDVSVLSLLIAAAARVTQVKRGVPGDAWTAVESWGLQG